MSTFTNFAGHSIQGYRESTLPDIDADTLMMDESVEPCFEDNFLVAAARVCAENTINMNTIFQAASIQEFCYLEETGTEMIYEEGKLKGFFNGIIKALNTLWEKIKSVFKKAIGVFSKKSKDNKEFLSKNKEKLDNIKAADLKGKYNGYSYTFYDGGEGKIADAFTLPKQFTDLSSMEKCIDYAFDAVGLNKAKNFKNPLNTLDQSSSSEDNKNKAKQTLGDAVKRLSAGDWKAKIEDTVRAGFVNKFGGSSESSVSSDKFSETLKVAIQGDDSKSECDLSSVFSIAYEFLKESEKISSALDKGLKEWKENIDQSISSITQYEKEYGEANAGKENTINYVHTVGAQVSNLLTGVKNVGITAQSVVIQELQACNGQSQAICVQALSESKSKKSSNDDKKSIGHESSILSDFELI